MDYRILNSFTRPMYYPSKSIDEVLFKMANVDIMSALNLHNAYNQIPLTPRAGPISTFATHIGSYTLRKMSFGLKNAAFTLNLCMDLIFGELREHTDNYVDDIFISSPSVQAHILHLGESLAALSKANMQARSSKTKLFRRHLKMLGHKVGQGYIRPDSTQTEALKHLPPPKNRTAVRSFLGMSSFFRKFIKDYTKIALPLTALTSDKKNMAMGHC